MGILEKKLINASRDNSCWTVSVLIALGADVNYKENRPSRRSNRAFNMPEVKNGYSPLMWAVENGSLKTVKALLKAKNININLLAGCNNPQTTPLMLAIQLGKEKIVDLFIDHGFRHKCIDYEDIISRTICAKYKASIAVKLIQSSQLHGTQINHQCDSTGTTKLIDSIRSNQLEVFCALLELEGIDVNIKDKHGMTALMIAAHQWYAEKMIPKLISAGADINDINPKTGDTALMAAAIERKSQGVNCLINAGADINYINPKTGANTLMKALGSEHSCFGAHYLISAGADVNYTNPKTGDTALILAACYKDPWIARCLMKAGANVNYVNPTTGHTALTIAASINDSQTAAYLTNAGANVNYVNPTTGHTALTIAASINGSQTAAYLTNAGANVNYANPIDGCTPIMYSVTSKRYHPLNTVIVLLEAGADISFYRNKSYQYYLRFDDAFNHVDFEVKHLLDIFVNPAGNCLKDFHHVYYVLLKILIGCKETESYNTFRHLILSYFSPGMSCVPNIIKNYRELDPMFHKLEQEYIITKEILYQNCLKRTQKALPIEITLLIFSYASTNNFAMQKLIGEYKAEYSQAIPKKSLM